MPKRFKLEPKILSMSCILVLLLIPIQALSQSSVGSILFRPLNAVIDVENSEERAVIKALAYTIRTLRTYTERDLELDGLTRDNFVFISRLGSISEGSLSYDALSVLTPVLKDQLRSIRVDSKSCFIDPGQDLSGRAATIAIFDGDETEDGEHIFQCFTAAVHQHFFDSLPREDLLEWRKVLFSIIETRM